MGEHTTNLEHFLSRPRETRRGPEIVERWRGDRAWDVRAFEEFKKSPEGATWFNKEMHLMDFEEVSLKTRTGEIERIRASEHDPTPWPKLYLTDKLPDFMVKDGSLAAPARWDSLREHCFEEVARNSTKLQTVWHLTDQAAFEELKPNDKLSQKEIDNFKEAMDEVWKELGDWDKARYPEPVPNLSKPFAAKCVKKFEQLLGRHKAVFDKIDGAQAPTAKYKVVAMVQAISEAMIHQRESLLPPPSYSKMLDRMGAIPGRQDVPKEVTNSYKGSWRFENPHKVWEELIGTAMNEGREMAKKVDPHFSERFEKLIGFREPGDWRPAINFKVGLKRLPVALADWPAGKVSWPAGNKTFEATHHIAWNIELMKNCIDEGLYGLGKEHAAIREKLHAVIDGLAERISNEIELLQ
jgi:hypothetical protein